MFGIAQTFDRGSIEPPRVSLSLFEQPWQPPITLLYKLMSDSWEISIFTCRPSCLNENHRFDLCSNAKCTSKLDDILIFLQNPNYRKNKENENWHFRTLISIVLSSWTQQMHMILHWKLGRNSLRTHMRKTCISRIMTKTCEIPTFPHPTINIKTI